MELATERRRFTADEVWRMIETGVLRADERVELIEGELLVVPPQGPVHSSLTVVLHARLERAYGAGHHVRDHSPVVGTRDSIPEPDIAVVRGDPRDFLKRLPGPAEVALVVEVAHSSVAIDRKKANVYALAGYRSYWLVHVDARGVEVREAPRDGMYTKTELFDEHAQLTVPGASSAATLTVAELLP